MNMSNYTYQDTFSFSLPTRYLKALSHMMATNDARYYLNGIHITNGRLEASDGHVAMRITAPGKICSANEKPLIISADTVKRMAKDIKVKDLGSTVEVWNGQYKGESVDFVSGTFPDVGRLLINPEDCSGKVAQFNPELLVRIQKAVKCLHPQNKQNHGAFELHHNDNGAGIVKIDRETETIHSVVMPWRI